ncbi:MAG: flagellar protein FlgN [Gammaproteobacteria bacterium HGW-Gammaproteobacteria-7]|nr:MAG: flagellar protein FlgN [Gammaproteobacteria bacterium HGW-Gammaproteobacteria-7]
MSAHATSLLQALAQALEGERKALLENDAEALIAAGRSKLHSLQGLERIALSADLTERVAELAEFNRANGALLARRQREVRWALRHLGRIESAPAYDGRGQLHGETRARVLAHA